MLNIFLAVYQFNFQPIAWYVTIGWIALGLFLYYAVFEKHASVIEPQVLLTGRTSLESVQQPTVLVALHNPDTVKPLVEFAYPVAKQRNARLIAVSVVEVPHQMPIHEGMRYAHHKEPLLNRAKKIAREHKIPLDTDVVIAHHISDGILASAERNKASALVMGWKGFTNARDRIFGEIADRIIRLAPCDLMLLKMGERKGIRHCLLPTAGGPNARLAAVVLDAISNELNLDVTTGYVVPENAPEAERKVAHKRISETLKHIKSYDTRIIEASTVAGGIANASREYDLLVIGAAKEPFFRKMLFGEIPEKVARFSPTAVLVVKKYEGVVKSLLKKILG